VGTFKPVIGWATVVTGSVTAATGLVVAVGFKVAVGFGVIVPGIEVAVGTGVLVGSPAQVQSWSVEQLELTHLFSPETDKHFKPERHSTSSVHLAQQGLQAQSVSVGQLELRHLLVPE